MNKREIKRLARSVAASWIESNVGTVDPQPRLTEDEQGQFDVAIYEVAAMLNRYGETRGGTGR